jgi:hypothetical protein
VISLLIALLPLSLGSKPAAGQSSTLVDLDLPASSLQNAAPILSKAIGKEVIVRTSAKDELLFVCVRQADPAMLAKQIETSLYVQIEQTPTEWIISRPAAQLQQIESDSYQYRLKNAQKLIEQVKAITKSMTPFTASSAKKIASNLRDAESFFTRATDNQTPEQQDKFSKILEESNRQLPSARFSNRLIAEFPPEQLAQVPDGERRTYALRAGVAQLPLPPSAAALIKDFIREQQIWSNLPENQVLDPEMGFMRKAEAIDEKRIENIVVQVVNRYDSLSVDSFIISGKGIRFSEAQYYEKGDQYFSGVQLEQSSPFKEYPNFKPSNVTQWITQFTFDESIFMKPRPETVKLALGNPAQIDPLSFGFSETLRAYAEKYKKNIVAPGLDSCFMIHDPRTWNPLPDTQGLPYTVVDSGHWRTLKLRNPIAELARNTSRTALQAMLSKQLNGGHIEIEELGNWYRKRFPTSRVHEQVILDQITNLIGETSSKSIRFQSTALLASLSTSEREMAKRAGITFSSLNSEARMRLNQLFFFEADERFLSDAEEGMDESDGSIANDEKFIYQMYPDLAFPRGLPSNMKLKIDDQIDTVIEVKMTFVNDGNTAQYRMTPRELAETLYSSERATDENKIKVDLDRIYLGKRRFLNMIFVAENGLQWNSVLTDEVTYKDKSYRFKDLPTDLRKKIDQEMEQVKKDYSSIPPSSQIP